MDYGLYSHSWAVEPCIILRKLGCGAMNHTCGIERSCLLELCIGQSLLVVQHTRVEEGAGPVVLLQCLSLW